MQYNAIKEYNTKMSMSKSVATQVYIYRPKQQKFPLSQLNAWKLSDIKKNWVTHITLQ